MCQCYQVGGPFIAEDPDCPVHGTQAQRDREEAEARTSDLQQQVEDLQARVATLEQQLAVVARVLDRLASTSNP